MKNVLDWCHIAFCLFTLIIIYSWCFRRCWEQAGYKRRASDLWDSIEQSGNDETVLHWKCWIQPILWLFVFKGGFPAGHQQAVSQLANKYRNWRSDQWGFHSRASSSCQHHFCLIDRNYIIYIMILFNILSTSQVKDYGMAGISLYHINMENNEMHGHFARMLAELLYLWFWLFIFWLFWHSTLKTSYHCFYSIIYKTPPLRNQNETHYYHNIYNIRYILFECDIHTVQ